MELLKNLMKKTDKEHSIQFYQDTEKLGIWDLMKGKKDTFYIIDRCGYLHKQLDHPQSALRKRKERKNPTVHHLAMVYRLKTCEPCAEMDHSKKKHTKKEKDNHDGHNHKEGEHHDHDGHNHKEGEHHDHDGHNHKEGEHHDHDGHNHKEGENHKHDGHSH